MAAAQCVLEIEPELGECPIWSVEDRCLYWVDILGKRFHRFDPATGRNRSWDMPDMPGSFVLREGGGVVIAMRDGFHDFDPATGQLARTIDAPYDSAKLRFNDGRTDRQGRFWVGTILADIGSEDRTERAFYSLEGSTLRKRIAPIDLANGTAFSIDGRTMYRSESFLRTILAYDFDPVSGEPENERVFATVPDHLGMPDGATIDSEDGYWTALIGGPNGGGVARFTPDGGLDELIELPVPYPTMPAFGGPDLSTLYVTGAHSGLLAIETGFRGVPETLFKG